MIVSYSQVRVEEITEQRLRPYLDTMLGHKPPLHVRKSMFVCTYQTAEWFRGTE